MYDISSLRVNPLNTQLNPIYHLLALLGAHHILHISRIRVKTLCQLSNLSGVNLRNIEVAKVGLKSVCSGRKKRNWGLVQVLRRKIRRFEG